MVRTLLAASREGAFCALKSPVGPKCVCQASNFCARSPNSLGRPCASNTVPAPRGDFDGGPSESQSRAGGARRVGLCPEADKAPNPDVATGCHSTVGYDYMGEHRRQADRHRLFNRPLPGGACCAGRQHSSVGFFDSSRQQADSGPRGHAKNECIESFPSALRGHEAGRG